MLLVLLSMVVRAESERSLGSSSGPNVGTRSSSNGARVETDAGVASDVEAATVLRLAVCVLALASFAVLAASTLARSLWQDSAKKWAPMKMIQPSSSIGASHSGFMADVTTLFYSGLQSCWNRYGKGTAKTESHMRNDLFVTQCLLSPYEVHPSDTAEPQLDAYTANDDAGELEDVLGSFLASKIHGASKASLKSQASSAASKLSFH